MDEKEKIENIENNILNEKAVISKERRVLLERDENEIIEARKEKVFAFFKNNPALVFIGVLIILILLGVSIRSLPLSDHGGKPGLWDITTNDYTLGPDLDPFLFLRYAKEMIAGDMPQIDMMRNVPLGFDNSMELPMVGHAIVWTYKLVNLFGEYSINFAGAFMPVLAFALTIIAFFFFVREIFIRKNDKKSELKANIIASVASLFMIVIPEFLSRTVAGIPEKESLAFLFMFLAFYLFLKAWKSENILTASIFGVLAGLSTALMGLTWGGVTYIYITIGLATFVAFLMNKVEKKESIAYGLWLISALVVTFLMTNKYSLKGFVTSIDTGLATLTLGILIVHYIIWNTKARDMAILEKIKLPKNIISVILTVLAGLIFILIISPSLISEKLVGLYHTLIQPVTGRWSTTVAENRQPYFSEWLGSFGQIFFWLFISGSIVLFRKMFNSLEKKKAWILTGLYCFFLIGLIFSRYAPHPNLLDGEGIISLFLYFGSALLLAGMVIYYYIEDHKNREGKFKKIKYEYLLLFSLLVLCLFTARSAIRLIMVLAPIATIFLGFLIGELIQKLMDRKDKDKMLILIIAIIVFLLSAYVLVNFYQTTKGQAYNSVPYYYTFQWQKAMEWVRDYTPATAVFAHWWDYGYWLQSIGNRATVTDGGNAIVWWNYLTGRLVLTGDNQKDALDFLYSHNATNLLIDSSDIGKYGAFSQIGSDANLDRLSQGPVTMISDPKQIQETKNEVIRPYNIPAGNGKVSLIPLEEDLTFEINGSETTLFKENSALMGINIKYVQNNDSVIFRQPQAVFYSNGKQITVPMRYLYYNKKFKDFGEGIESTAYIIQRLYSSGQGLQMDQMGAMIYLSPRIMRGMLGQVYVLNDPFKKWNAFTLAHSEQDYILSQISSQGIELGEFTYYEGLRGPIKIWNITYTGDEEVKADYLLRTVPDYITWKF